MFMYDQLPSYFDRKYDPFCGSLPDIIAVMAGIKPLTRLNFFKKDIAFRKFVDFAKKRGVLVAENCGTTDRGKIGVNYLYLSKSKGLLNTYRYSDPDLDLGETSQPPKAKIAELEKFAKALGYPDCCICNYLKDGQKKVVSSYRKSLQENHASFFMNNFLHSISNYYLSFHLPCSPRCKKTEAYNRKIFNAIEEYEPEFAKRLRHILTMPMIVWFNGSKLPFDDRLVALLDGSRSKNIITYSKCFLLRTRYPNNKPFSENFEKSLLGLKEGDKLSYDKEKMRVYKGKKLIHIIQKNSDLASCFFHFQA